MMRVFAPVFLLLALLALSALSREISTSQTLPQSFPLDIEPQGPVLVVGGGYDVFCTKNGLFQYDVLGRPKWSYPFELGCSTDTAFATVVQSLPDGTSWIAIYDNQAYVNFFNLPCFSPPCSPTSRVPAPSRFLGVYADRGRAFLVGEEEVLMRTKEGYFIGSITPNIPVTSDTRPRLSPDLSNIYLNNRASYTRWSLQGKDVFPINQGLAAPPLIISGPCKSATGCAVLLTGTGAVGPAITVVETAITGVNGTVHPEQKTTVSLPGVTLATTTQLMFGFDETDIFFTTLIDGTPGLARLQLQLSVFPPSVMLLWNEPIRLLEGEPFHDWSFVPATSVNPAYVIGSTPSTVLYAALVGTTPPVFKSFRPTAPSPSTSPPIIVASPTITNTTVSGRGEYAIVLATKTAVISVPMKGTDVKCPTAPGCAGPDCRVCSARGQCVFGQCQCFSGAQGASCSALLGAELRIDPDLPITRYPVQPQTEIQVPIQLTVAPLSPVLVSFTSLPAGLISGGSTLLFLPTGLNYSIPQMVTLRSPAQVGKFQVVATVQSGLGNGGETNAASGYLGVTSTVSMEVADAKPTLALDGSIMVHPGYWEQFRIAMTSIPNSTLSINAWCANEGVKITWSPNEVEPEDFTQRQWFWIKVKEYPSDIASGTDLSFQLDFSGGGYDRLYFRVPGVLNLDTERHGASSDKGPAPSGSMITGIVLAFVIGVPALALAVYYGHRLAKNKRQRSTRPPLHQFRSLQSFPVRHTASVGSLGASPEEPMLVKVAAVGPESDPGPEGNIPELFPGDDKNEK